MIYNASVFILYSYIFILFYGFMVQQKIYLQAEKRVCEQNKIKTDLS